MQAKFVKACGTLPETPIEIRKACEKFKGSPELDKYSETSKFHSWLPNTSIKKLQLDNQNEDSRTPVKLWEDLNQETFHQNEASLSSWVKPSQSTTGEDNPNIGTVAGKSSSSGKTPGDRPIIGMVAAHWNENEASRISPKWWDGNGIPNSTNKYKE
ncbi:ASPARTYL/GLUTAMYL-TRNA(ASN/GLN) AMIDOTRANSFERASE SUBUNIT, partial [Salix viminalis]